MARPTNCLGRRAAPSRPSGHSGEAALILRVEGRQPRVPPEPRRAFGGDGWAHCCADSEGQQLVMAFASLLGERWEGAYLGRDGEWWLPFLKELLEASLSHASGDDVSLYFSPLCFRFKTIYRDSWEKLTMEMQ